MIQPLVSIIVPVYNVENYLTECLDSLVNQTYPNIEIICIDDGSTDNSPKILNQYKQSHSNIKTITTENQGQASARNLGLKEASGDFIMFVDSDDWIAVEAIETVFSKGFFDNIKVDAVCFGLQQVKNGIKSPQREYSFEGVQPIDETLALKISPEPFAKLYRSSFLRQNKITFPEGLWYEDMTFYWHCISCVDEIGLMKEVYYNYRKRDDSTMGNSEKKTLGMTIHHLYNLEAIYKIWSDNKYLDKHNALFKHIFELYVQQAYKFLCDEEREDFIEKLKSLTDNIGIQPQRFSLTYDLIHNNRIMPFKYRLAKSIRKKLL